MHLTLVRPNLIYKTSYLEGLEEVESDEKTSWIYLGESAALDTPFVDFNSYVEELLRREHTPPGHFVCDTIYWAILDNEVVGRISIRHELNEFLQKVGGHIGYIVRPKFRKKGIATKMLELALNTSRAQIINKLLLTCDEDNLASEKTILKNGGKLQDIIDVGENRNRKKRFWITLAK